MTSEDTRVQCQALTQAGNRCQKTAQPGSDYCHLHKPVEIEEIEEQVAEGAAEEQVPAERMATQVVEEQVQEDLDEEELRQQLIEELDELAGRVQAQTPEYEPPPFSPRRLVALIEENLSQLPQRMRLDILEQLRGSLNKDLFDIEVWKGVWYMLNYTLRYQADLVKRRFTGEYDTDEWGLDWEFVDAARPFFSFLYKVYWRVQTSGMDNVPMDGRALLVSNHSGQIPWDGTMIGAAVMTEHPAQRLVRTLYADWSPRVPFFSSWLVRLGQTLDCEENGARLLEQDELVSVFPEGNEGAGKLYKNRYQLARFGSGSFINMAIKTRAPIIPVSVVGAEETYPALAKSTTLSSITKLPYVPITPTFPWLGALGFIPLPTKWYIDIGQPISLDAYGPDAAENLVLISQVSDQIRNTIQDMVRERLHQRRTAFF